MVVFSFGCVLFLFAFAVHVVRWRVTPPKGSAAILIRTVVAAIFLGVSIALAIDALIPGAAALLPQSVGAWCQALILALAIAASYVMTYPAIEVDSPTFLVVEQIKAARSGALARADLYQKLDDGVLIRPHIEDLLNEQLAEQQAGRLCLTAKGRRLASSFMAWRRVLNAPKGG